jgi:hypothetical protein
MFYMGFFYALFAGSRQMSNKFEACRFLTNN